MLHVVLSTIEKPITLRTARSNPLKEDCINDMLKVAAKHLPASDVARLRAEINCYGLELTLLKLESFNTVPFWKFCAEMRGYNVFVYLELKENQIISREVPPYNSITKFTAYNRPGCGLKSNLIDNCFKFSEKFEVLSVFTQREEDKMSLRLLGFHEEECELISLSDLGYMKVMAQDADLMKSVVFALYFFDYSMVN